MPVWSPSLTSPPSDRLDLIRRYVDLQRNYLRNPLPPGPGICPVCRGARSGYATCRQCWNHRRQLHGLTSDVVIPIAYSPRTGPHAQHHHNLWAYKSSPSTPQARWSLLALLLLFLHEHMGCIERALGGKLTHAITVPSTRGRSAPHPLSALVGDRLGLSTLNVTANPAYGRDEREPHTDWTSGARTQSLAYALKRAGTAATAVVVLGRHVNPDDQQSHALLEAIKNSLFEPSRCALDDNS